MRHDELKRKLQNLIERADTASGMLLVPAVKDAQVKAAMEKVSDVSFELGIIINEL